MQQISIQNADLTFIYFYLLVYKSYCKIAQESDIK